MIKLLQGDALELLQILLPETIDCAIVDPPYGQTSLPWDKPVREWQAAVHRVLKPTGSMWVFGSLRHFIKYAEDFRGWKMSHDIVWEKHNGAGFFNDRFRTVHELVAHFYKDTVQWASVYKEPQFTNDATARTVRRKKTPSHWTGERNPTHYVSHDGGPKLARSVFFERSTHGYAEHPTQKPEAAIERLIRYACPKNGVLLDPFAGSGTVGLVANQLKRHAILFESNQDFVEIAKRRCGLTPPP